MAGSAGAPSTVLALQFDPGRPVRSAPKPTVDEQQTTMFALAQVPAPMGSESVLRRLESRILGVFMVALPHFRYHGCHAQGREFQDGKSGFRA